MRGLAIFAALGFVALSSAPAPAQSISSSWENGPPRSNSWARPSQRFETRTQRRAAIDRGERDYQPPAYREREPAAPTGLSGPPRDLSSPEPAEPASREIKRVDIFDRDRPWRAPRPVWYPAPEHEIPTPWDLPTPKE